MPRKNSPFVLGDSIAATSLKSPLTIGCLAFLFSGTLTSPAANGNSIEQSISVATKTCQSSRLDRANVVWISRDPAWPHLLICNNQRIGGIWSWKVRWRNFSRSGSASIPDSGLDMFQQLADIGGEIEIDCCGDAASVHSASYLTMKVHVRAKNPTHEAIAKYIQTEQCPFELERIAKAESRMTQFNSAGEPLASQDGLGGYGIFQLTYPPPTYEQAWNWKRNIDGGAQLIAQKDADAQAYLSSPGEPVNSHEASRERISLWNGGHYYDWDPNTKQFVRKNIMCDPKTSNIGWDMDDPENRGKTAEELRRRDAKNYSRRRRLGDHWRPTGVCYADHLLG